MGVTYDAFRANEEFLFFNIWVTMRCNFRCRYCYEMENKSNVIMSYETAKQTVSFILDISRKNNCRSIWINFHGGEPLLNHKIIDEILDLFESSKEAHDKNRIMQTGEGTYDVAIKNALDYLKKFNNIRLRMVVTPNNTKHLYDGVVQLAEYGFRCIIQGIDYSDKTEPLASNDATFSSNVAIRVSSAASRALTPPTVISSSSAVYAPEVLSLV